MITLHKDPKKRMPFFRSPFDAKKQHLFVRGTHMLLVVGSAVVGSETGDILKNDGRWHPAAA